VITKIRQNKELIDFLKKDEYINLNVLGCLKHNTDTDFYIYNSDLTNGVIVCNERRYLCFLCTNNADFMNELCDMLPVNYMNFSGVPDAIANIFVEDKEVVWENLCKTYVLKGDFALPSNLEYEGDTLNLEDADIVNDHYTFKSDDSIYGIKDDIIHRDSSCVRINGELASWCLIHGDDDSLGPIYTKETYRKLGLGEEVTYRLMEKQLSKGNRPYVQILRDNLPALNFVNKIKGMEFSHDCIWFGVEK